MFSVADLQRASYTKYGEMWYGKAQVNESREALYSLIQNARKEVKLLTGEANYNCYDTEAFSKACNYFLGKNSRDKGQLLLVFHKDKDPQKAVQRLKEDNKVLIALKEKYPDRVHIYWQRERNPKHFSVFDSNAIFAEQRHEQGAPREVLVKESTIELGKLAEEEFDRIVGTECEEILKN